MIELITGTPGAGKTTFAVSTRVVEEAKRVIQLDPETCMKQGLEQGATVTRRVVVAGIRGLAVEHESLPHALTRNASSVAEVERWGVRVSEVDEATGKRVESDVPVHQRLPGDPPVDVPALMQNWWLWCKPGDLIVIDEAQFVMPRGTLGRKPPYWIQALEIHRHYGVDFLLITQHPQLIDTTVRALVGLHRHIRPVMGSGLCMVYTWDHASNPERYNLANKSQFLRRSSHYRLFHSAAAHVKPPASGRWALVAVPVLLAVGGVSMAAKFGAFSKSAPTAAAVAPVSPGAGQPALAAAMPRPAGRPAGFVDVPKLSGCYALPDRCECFGEDGRPVRVARPMCELSSRGFDGLVQWEPRRPPPEVDAPGKSAAAPVPAASSSGKISLPFGA